MLILFLGNNGTGKTSLLTKFAYGFNRTIYSNYQLDLENYKPIEIADLIDMTDLKEGNILLDEGYIYLESRRSGKALNLITTYLIFQKRKRLLDIYITAQLKSSLDKRVRHLANIIIYCKPRINIDSDDFYYTYHDIDSNIVFNFMITYESMSKYFKYFNTYEIIQPPNKSKIEFDLIKDNPERLTVKLKEIAEVILPMKKITHDTVSSALVINNFDIRYKKFLYPYLKGSVNFDDN